MRRGQSASWGSCREWVRRDMGARALAVKEEGCWLQAAVSSGAAGVLGKKSRQALWRGTGRCLGEQGSDVSCRQLGRGTGWG